MFLLRPRLADLGIISFYTGTLVMGIGLAMLAPLVVSLIALEWMPALDFVIGASLSFSVGLLLRLTCATKCEMDWRHGLLVVPVAWMVAAFLGAVPLYLSGHFASFLNAVFDSMSGFTTTGLALVEDLDHLSYGHNFWRHFMHFIGGQGIIVVILTVMTGGASGIYGMFIGEAREEKILPNLIHTARFIWLVSFVYLGVGTLVLTLVLAQEGLSLSRALFHGITIFMAAFDTGGFAPQSQSILYYHSAAFELALVPIMVAGAVNFAIHYALFSGNRREILKNIETVTLFISISVLFALVAFALAQVGTYAGASAVFSKGFFQLISAHTGTGFMTVYASEFSALWGTVAVAGIVIAMALGASAGSTAGGIKALRVAAVAKAFNLELRKMLLPPSAVVVEKYHHLKRNVVTERMLLSVFLVVASYVAAYVIGGIIAMALGYPPTLSIFESVSATANVGLTAGITLPTMENALKVVFILQMWAGRLEFASVMALIGFIVSAVRGK